MPDRGLLLSQITIPNMIATKTPPKINHIRGILSNIGIESWASEYLLNAWKKSKTIPKTYNAVTLATIKMMPVFLISTQTLLADSLVLKG